MKVLYVHTDTIQDSDSTFVIPIGMVGISNIITSIVDEYYAIDVPIEKDLNPNYDVLLEIKKINPDIIFIDLHWYIYSYETITLSQKIKNELPNCIIILGGITASIFYKEIMDTYNTVDFIVRGDAEFPIEQLLISLKNGDDKYLQIPNLSYKKNGKCIHNANTWICKSFDGLNYYNYDFIKNKEHLFEKQGLHRGVVNSPKLAWIPIARGCNHNCSYCGGNCKMFSKIFNRKNMLLNDPTNIIECMQKLYDKYNIDTFGITHGIEIFDREYAFQILNGIENLSFKPGIYNYLFQLPTKEIIRKFIEVTDEEKTIVGLPISTGNQKTRIKNGKIFSNKEIFEFLDEFVGSKIKIEIYFIDNLLYDDGNNYTESKKLISEIFDKYLGIVNMQISYGFEVIQPFSKKHQDSDNSLTNFNDYYYRFSPNFNSEVRRGKKLEYLIGEKEYDSKSYKRLLEMNEFIEEKERRYKDIVFVCPPSGKNNTFEKSIGVAYLQAYIKKNGYSSIQLIPKSNNIDDITKEILSYNSKIIGFSCYDSNYYYVKLIAKKLKRINPNISILVGGPAATFSNSIIFDDCKEIDFCQMGYGETALVKLLNKLLKNLGELKEIEGLAYRESENILRNELTKLPQNIDEFPSPYLNDIGFFPERKIVFTSRGCNHNCVYCNCATMCERKIFYHSEDRVIEELKYISDKEPGSYVLIGDDAFTLNIERAKRICKQIISKNINLKLFCETRADRLDDELLQLMKDAGFVKVDFGLESAVLKILRNIKKTFYRNDDTDFKSEKNFLEVVQKAVEKAKKLNLDPMVNIITGLPGEKPEDALETLNYVKKLDIKSYSHNYLRIYNGTEIYNDYKKWGYKVYQDEFKLPFIVEYPFNVKEITPLSNSVNRNKIVKLKQDFIEVLLKNKDYFEFKNINELQIKKLKNIDLNEEIFVKVNDEKEITQFVSFIVKNEIPTNNINFIIENAEKIKCFNSNDKESYILAIKIKNRNFELPKKYYELLYIENMTEEILSRFKNINVNPYVNKFVITNLKIKKEDKNFWKELIEDYAKLYLKDGNINSIYLFLEYINYNIEDLNVQLFEKLYKDKVITVKDGNTIIKFLKYYMLGVVDDE